MSSYIQKSGLVSKLVNRKYLSPFNLAVSKDGTRLYVVARKIIHYLLLIQIQKKVLKKIKVGLNPHSVILSNDGQKALCKQSMV